ncbi:MULTISPECIES: AMP-binding protein [Cupriavidus]
MIDWISAAPPSAWTVGRLLAERAARSPERPFVQMVGARPQTYGTVHAAAMRVAAALRQAGVAPGDSVVLMLPNSLAAIHAWLGANLLGAVDVSINTGYRGEPLRHAIDQAAARFLLIAADYLPQLREVCAGLPALETIVVVEPDGGEAQDARHDARQDGGAPSWQPPADGRCWLSYCAMLAGAGAAALPDVGAADIASVIYTSGTSGPAKGVRMPHAQVVLLACRSARHCRLDGDDVYYSFHPLYHMAGKFMAVLATLVAGGRIVLDQRFSAPAWLERIRACGATVGGAHGPMLEMIFAQPPTARDREHRMRRLCTAPFPRHIAAAFEARFGIRGQEVWGMTEVGIPCWSSLDEPLRAGSCGRVDEDWFEVRVADPHTDLPLPAGETGEILVRPRQPFTLMQGYMGYPEKTVEAWRNLWFHSGDAGYFDARGYLHFVDRIADRIRRKAENISSFDIETAALRCAGVAEAAAVGVPSGLAGDDDIKLCVVCHPGGAPEPVALLRELAALLPHYMVPRYLEFLPALPRSATSKLRRAALRHAPYGREVWDRKAHGIALRDLSAPS